MKHFHLGKMGRKVVGGKLSYKYFNHKIVFAGETYRFRCMLRLCVLKDIERKQNSRKCNRNAFVVACVFLCFLLFVIAEISISTNVDFMVKVLSKGWEIFPSKSYQATSKNSSQIFLQCLSSLNLLFFCALKRVLVLSRRISFSSNR